eukprot:GHVP01030057.1.p1 GENE.GHVP01030057.1~~GHVP01030057.1.p1  ORF type:complete len:118 (+),score=3.62 GHVP01030057.1:388-741(+)
MQDGVPIACRRLWNFLANFKSIFFTFFPIILFNQFRLFNFVFLIVDLSQFIPALKVGLLFTYIFMLSFVLSVTCIKEAFDDIKGRPCFIILMPFINVLTIFLKLLSQGFYRKFNAHI